MLMVGSICCPADGCARPDPAFHTETAQPNDGSVILGDTVIVGRCPDHGPWRNLVTVAERGLAVRGEEGPDGRGREVLGLGDDDRRRQVRRLLQADPMEFLRRILKVRAS